MALTRPAGGGHLVRWGVGAVAGAVAVSADSSASLGSHRLTVRENENQRVERPTSGYSTFRDSLDYSDLALTGETEYRSVGEGENARIRTVADAVDGFRDYIDNKRNASLILRDRESGDVRVMPYNHRWTPEYRAMTYAKLKDAERALDAIYGDGPTPVTMLSLTAYQRGEDGRPRPPGEVLDDLLDGWDKFRRVLDRATEGARTEYIRVLEPHASGYPHLHVAIFGVANPSLGEKVRELWAEKYEVGSADAHQNAVSVASGRSAQLQEPAAYIMKYLGKTTVRADGGAPAPSDETPGEVDAQNAEAFEAFSALLWVTGKRQFSASAALSAAMKRPQGEGSGGSWEFLGVGYGFEIGTYEGEDADQLVAHLSRGPWEPPPGVATGMVRYGPLG